MQVRKIGDKPLLGSIMHVHPSVWLPSCSTEELWYILHEIIQPSATGPFGMGYREDAEYEAFVDAMEPLEQALEEHWDDIKRATVPCEEE